MKTKTCKRCEKQKPIDRFGTFKKRDGTYSSRGTCLDCRGEYHQKYFERLQKYRRGYNQARRTQKRERDAQRRAELRALVDKLKDVPCKDCGRHFPPVAMDFDHIGPKAMGIASMVAGAYKVELVLDEIAKCEIVCACCHRIRTAGRKQNLAPKMQR